MTNKTPKEKICPCIKCGQEPSVTHIYDLWYISCPKCDRIEVNPRESTVIHNWNEQNARRVKYARVKEIEKTRRAVEKKKAQYTRWAPIYHLDRNGLRCEEYCSTSDLAKSLGMNKNTIVGRFYRSKNNIIEVKGEFYERDTTTTSPRRSRKRNKNCSEK